MDKGRKKKPFKSSLTSAGNIEQAAEKIVKKESEERKAGDGKRCTSKFTLRN